MDISLDLQSEAEALRSKATRLDRLAALLDRTALKHYDRRRRKIDGAFDRAGDCDTAIAQTEVEASKARRRADMLDLSGPNPDLIATIESWYRK